MLLSQTPLAPVQMDSQTLPVTLRRDRLVVCRRRVAWLSALMLGCGAQSCAVDDLQWAVQAWVLRLCSRCRGAN